MPIKKTVKNKNDSDFLPNLDRLYFRACVSNIEIDSKCNCNLVGQRDGKHTKKCYRHKIRHYKMLQFIYIFWLLSSKEQKSIFEKNCIQFPCREQQSPNFPLCNPHSSLMTPTIMKVSCTEYTGPKSPLLCYDVSTESICRSETVVNLLVIFIVGFWVSISVV